MSEPPLPAPVRARILLPFSVVTLIWGSTWLVIRDQLGVVPPTWSVAYRFGIAGAVMVIYALSARTSLRAPRKAWGVIGLVGLAQFVLNFNLVYRAESFIASGLVAVIFALLIVPNAVLARIFLGQELSRPFLAGSAVAMAGIGLLFAHELRLDGADPGAVLRGLGLTLLAVLSASVANVVQGSAGARAMTIPALLAWSMLLGAGANAVWAWLTDGPPSFDLRAGYIAGLLYLGVLASALAFLLYYPLIRTIGAARAAYSSVLVPIIAMALSTLFEGYRWSAMAAVGSALALAGLILALRLRSPSR